MMDQLMVFWGDFILLHDTRYYHYKYWFLGLIKLEIYLYVTAKVFTSFFTDSSVIRVEATHKKIAIV